MAEEITVTIKSSVEKKYELTVPLSLTVLELKDRIAAEADVPAESQRLIYSGRVLKDADELEKYNIKNGHTIHLVKSAAARANNNTTASASATSSTGSAAQSTPASNHNNVPSNISAGTGAFNPLAGLTGARYAGLAQLPSESMFGPDGGMQMPSEEDIERMLENPMVQQQMNEMLRNPQMLDYMISQNPQLSAMGPQVREMMQSEQFRQMFTNPQMMRQMREMSRMFGGGAGGFGGAPQNAFPAPGNADEPETTSQNTESVNTNTSTTTTSANTNTNTNTNSNAAANPFAALFPGGAPPANPFALFGNNQGAQGAGSTANAGGLPQIDPAVLQSILGSGGSPFASFGGAGAGAGAAPRETDNRPPEERYESQLRQLNDMGFSDFDSNVRALRRSGGSVQGAVENLLNGI